MNKEQLLIAKEEYNAISQFIIAPEIYSTYIDKFPILKEIEPIEIFCSESIQFMASISNINGVITQEALTVMNYITGENLSLQDIREIAKENELLKGEAGVPFSVVFLCDIENTLYEGGNMFETRNSIMNKVVRYYTLIGLLVANIDSKISFAQMSAINEYVNAIKQYARNNTVSPFFDD